MKVQIKNNAKTCLIISASIMVVALLMSIFGYGLNLGIDFSGGIIMRYEMGEAFDTDVVRAALAEQGITESQIAQAGDQQTELQVRIKDVEDADAMRAGFQAKLLETYPQTQYVSVERVGAVAGQSLIMNAVRSVLVAWLLMMVYIAIRFDLYSGMAAVFGLLHDVLMMVSCMVLLRAFVQINSTFIAALLTIVGYSINNTIIIFDRIRENNRRTSLHGVSRMEVVNISVQESLARTVNTTLTTLITTTVLYILGVESVRDFALPLIIGMMSGIYSSNMINGYVWMYLVENKQKFRFLRAKKA